METASMDDLTKHPRVLMIGRLADYLFPLLACDDDDKMEVMATIASALKEARQAGIEDSISAIQSIPGNQISAISVCKDLLKTKATHSAGRA